MVTKSTLTRVNEDLKKEGRTEKLVRGRGYYYLLGGESNLPSTSICVYRLEPEDYEFAREAVKQLFADGGIEIFQSNTR